MLVPACNCPRPCRRRGHSRQPSFRQESWRTFIGPNRQTPIILFQSAGVESRNSLSSTIAAEFTKIEGAPNSLTMRSRPSPRHPFG